MESRRPAGRDSRARPARPRDGGILAVAIERYLRELEKRPLRTKALTSCTLAAISDMVAQTLIRKGPLNWRRTGAMATSEGMLTTQLFGLMWSGPSAHFWQQFTERLFRGKRDGATIIKKTLLDQLSYGPLCNAMYMAYVALVVEGRSLDFTQQKLWNDFLGVQRNGWRVWPIVSLVNYRYIPLRLRVLFINAVALFWSTFLNIKSRSSVVTWQRKGL